MGRTGRTARPSLCLVIFRGSPSVRIVRNMFEAGPAFPAAVVAIGKFGVDGVVLLPFDKNLACLSPEAFAKNVLALQLKPLAVCVGEDFCFGKDRAGMERIPNALMAEYYAQRATARSGSGPLRRGASPSRADLSRPGGACVRCKRRPSGLSSSARRSR